MKLDEAKKIRSREFKKFRNKNKNEKKDKSKQTGLG